MRTCSAVALVEQRQHHCVDADGFTRAGGAGDQQVRHARQICHHRLAADVLAEGDRQRRVHLVVGLGAHDLPEGDHLALLVGDLKSHDALAGDDLDHAYAQDRQRARQVLGQGGDLARLDPGRGTQFEARDHRTGLDRDDLDIDVEVLELHFHQARERLQAFRGVQRLARRRIVQQLQRRQLVALGRIEQRHLALALHARTLLHDGFWRLDARRGATGGLLLLGLHRFLARLAPFAAFGGIALGDPAGAQPGNPGPGERAQAVHDGEPGDTEGERQAGHPGGDHAARWRRGNPVPRQARRRPGCRSPRRRFAAGCPAASAVSSARSWPPAPAGSRRCAPRCWRAC